MVSPNNAPSTPTILVGSNNTGQSVGLMQTLASDIGCPKRLQNKFRSKINNGEVSEYSQRYKIRY